MNKKEIEKLSITYLDNCIELYGESKWYQHTPYLSVESSPMSDDYDSEIKGEFDIDDNEIIIYFRNIRTKEDLARTILHEYIHYLQCPSWLTRYNNKCLYEKNPYEIQAYNAEDLNWETICR